MLGAALLMLKSLWANPMARKAALYAAIALAALYAFRQYTNKVYFDTKAELRQEFAKEQAKAHEQELIAVRQQLDAQAQANQKELETLRTGFLKAFQDQEQQLKNTERRMKTNLGAIDEKYKLALQSIASVSDNDLDNFLRGLSNRIASPNVDANGKAPNSGPTN